MKRALIVGAGSAIATAVARELANRGCALVLAARDPARLQPVADDLRRRGAPDVAMVAWDALDPDAPRTLAADCWGEGLDFLLIAHGWLPNQLAVENDVEVTRRVLQVNGMSGVELLTAFGGRFEEQGSGVIAVISSVSGDLGRRSNYVYGAAKSALSTFTDGLRARLAERGVCVLTIKPGYVDTPMTADMKKGLLWARPERVARDILAAAAKGGAGRVVYTPWFWRYIMLVVRAVARGRWI